MRPLQHQSAAAAQKMLLCCLVFACSWCVDARTRSAQAAQWGIEVPPQTTIESGPASRQIIPPVSADVQPIAPAPTQTPAITAPPITPSAPMLAQDARSKELQGELQQLQRLATPASGYGSSGAAAQAAWQLGLIYLHGAGVRTDQALAAQWFERSARQGKEPWAFAGTAWCAIDGCSAPSNPAAATRAINRLRAAHPARADFLAWLQASRLQPVQVNGNTSVAGSRPIRPDRQLLERAAAAGDIQANIELGIQAFANQQSSQAENYFRRVASRSTAAAENLALVRSRSSPSTETATAAAEGSALAALSMARMYHRGQGVPANYSEALRFYRLAEQRGSTEARKMIELIFSRPAPGGGLDPAWMQQLARADLSQPTPLIAAGITSMQLQREPSPLFDLLAPVWQKRRQQIAQ